MCLEQQMDHVKGFMYIVIGNLLMRSSSTGKSRMYYKAPLAIFLKENLVKLKKN